MQTLVDCAAKFEIDSFWIGKPVELVAHCLRNTGPFWKMDRKMSRAGPIEDRRTDIGAHQP